MTNKCREEDERRRRINNIRNLPGKRGRKKEKKEGRLLQFLPPLKAFAAKH